MKILMVSSEVSPLARTGGLGDVVGGLSMALKDMGYDIRLAMPRYSQIADGRFKFNRMPFSVSVPMKGSPVSAAIWSGGNFPGLPIYLIDAPSYFNRPELYGTPQGDYGDNAERFSFFNRAVLEMCKTFPFIPDIIHAHDWQTALVPIHLKTTCQNDPFLKNISSVLTIHNLGYQGMFDWADFSFTGLPPETFSMDGLEFYGKVNFLKGGLLYADILTTVSQTYSREIQTKEYGFGLEGVLQQTASKLFGIVNGIDTQSWNPATDVSLAETYHARNLTGKMINKEALQRRLALPVKKTVPVLGMVTRLAQQKGIDLILDALDALESFNVQLVILGAGDEFYQKKLLTLAEKHQNTFRPVIGFDDGLARLIYGGSDFFLMPSLYEPCGIGQLISLRYGTIPIVRKTGGLADTVVEFNPITGQGHGFLFDQGSTNALLYAVQQALACFKNSFHRSRLIQNAMALDFSWKPPAQKYAEIYQRLRS